MRVLAIFGALVAVAAGCGGSSDEPAGPRTTSDEPAGPRIVALDQFRSPSGNVGCAIGAGVARCDISERAWAPPAKPSTCQLDFGQGLEVTGTERGKFVCAGDTTLNPEAPALPYGTESRVGDFACRSEVRGMTCTSRSTGHGFFVSRENYRLL